MTLNDVLIKVEKFFASLEIDELYLMHGMIATLKGQTILLDKIKLMIDFKEFMLSKNGQPLPDISSILQKAIDSKKQVMEFEKIMEKGYEK